METEIQNKMLFSTSYSTKDVSDVLGNNIWGVYNKNKAFNADQYQSSLLKRQLIGGFSVYEKEQLRQTILKHELIFKNQLEELHRLYKRQRDLMNEIKRRELYPPPESPFLDLSFIRRPISTAYTCNTQSSLSFMKRELVSSPLISRERLTWECENADPKHNMFQQSLLNKRKEMRDVSMSIGSCNDLNANLCAERVNIVIDLNDPIETEENHFSRLNNKNETGEGIFGVTLGRVHEPSLDSPSNKSDITTKEKRTIFGIELSEENDDKNEILINSKKIFGFCVVPQSSPLTPNCVQNSDHIPTSKSSDLVTEKGLNSYISGLKLQIDLNLSINEDDGMLNPPLPEAIVKIATTEIDLEAPAVLESDADPPPESIFSENIFKKTCNEQNEELDKAAAEAIVAMSSPYDLIYDTTKSDPLSDFCDDESLHWFANLVSSYNDDENCDECLDGMDYLEFMTLNLKETNIEEFIGKSSLSLDYQKNEDKNSCNLSKRPRRGQGKRGKQRKDFQKDVLPGIVSLSRYEVAEDLHSFEELFKACGFLWQTNVSKRSNAKSGRGKRRLGECDTKEIRICEKIGSSGKLAVEEAAVAGWGKRMRRLPRRRCRVGGFDHT